MDAVGKRGSESILEVDDVLLNISLDDLAHVHISVLVLA